MKSAFVVATLGALLGGCATAPDTAAKAEVGSPTDKKQTMVAAAWPTGVKIHIDRKGNVVCPVLGDIIESPDKAQGFQDYNGVRYYFCCNGCPEKFKKDPEKYAEPGPVRRNAPMNMGH